MATCTHRTVVDIPRSALHLGAGVLALRLADARGLEVAMASTADGPGTLPGWHNILGTGANLSLTTVNTAHGRNLALAASFRCCGGALGGAIYAEDNENVSFENCTFARNYARGNATHVEQAVHLWAHMITAETTGM